MRLEYWMNHPRIINDKPLFYNMYFNSEILLDATIANLV